MVCTTSEMDELALGNPTNKCVYYKQLTNCFETMVGVAFTPALREAHENAVHLLCLGLEDNLAAKVTHGSQDIEASPVEQVHESLACSGAGEANIAQHGSCLCLESR